MSTGKIVMADRLIIKPGINHGVTTSPAARIT